MDKGKSKIKIKNNSYSIHIEKRGQGRKID
jgi:hypothetical protein